MMDMAIGFIDPSVNRSTAWTTYSEINHVIRSLRVQLKNRPKLSTHCLVLLMELAARQVVDGRIPKDKITLGTRVDIRHFSAALVGSRVRAVARLIAIEHHRLYFHVAAYDDVEKLAEGENEQVIVSRNLFLKKIRCKTLSKQQSDRQ